MLVQNAHLVVEKDISPTIVFKNKGEILGCEASRATTRRKLEELRMKTVGPKGKGRVDHLKIVAYSTSLLIISSFLFPSDAPFHPLGAK